MPVTSLPLTTAPGVHATGSPDTPKGNFAFVSLGCPKNTVDSERMLGKLAQDGYALQPDADGADVVVVNTCGFIDSAVTESLDAIGEALAENGKVIVTGCLGKRPEQIREAHPDVLSISGPQDYMSVMSAVHRALPPMHLAEQLFEIAGRRLFEALEAKQGGNAWIVHGKRRLKELAEKILQLTVGVKEPGTDGAFRAAHDLGYL
jgi:tRNA A37 methylthiotransferase MiaB